MQVARLIGIMSGTSADGVDAVVAEFSDIVAGSKEHRSFRLLGSASGEFSPEIRKEIIALNTTSSNELARSQELGLQLAHIYAKVARKAMANARIGSNDIEACAVHGQTIRHQPAVGYSLQAVHAPLLAELLGMGVISDFRNRDLAAGGQGAPLACGFHHWFFQPLVPCAVLNLGGIANLTILTEQRQPLGFDCGPANLLINAWAQKHLHCPFDDQGHWAASGNCNEKLFTRLTQHEFFHRPLPKTTGRDEFHLHWLNSLGVADYAKEDVQATLVELVAWSIAKELALFSEITQLYVCGGGVNNAYLMGRIASSLTEIAVQTTDCVGVQAKWMEAIAFAWLGWRHIIGKPGNLPSVTGARHERVLGCLHPV